MSVVVLCKSFAVHFVSCPPLEYSLTCGHVCCCLSYPLVVTVAGITLWVISTAFSSNSGHQEWVMQPHAVELLVKCTPYSFRVKGVKTLNPKP